ncbi:MAG: hemerythrin domain-containing protein [Bacteroidales bacterium]|nr:hemerythrin domain-containing protein [Bacteroidales bacterium]
MNTSAHRHPVSPAMKMAELLDLDFSLLGVATRLGLHFGFGDTTVAEVCQKEGIDPETFLLICRVYAFDGYRPTQEALLAANLRDILKYLHQSHAYYMEVMVPEMATALEQMIKPCAEKQQRVIWRFFADYKEELAKHFAYEEGQVFPYVEAVLNKQSGARFTIGEYEENHSNVEEKLEDLKNLVMKYIPAQCNQQEAYKVLFYIYSLERDLNKHTFIEDDILVPMVGRMENHE